MKRRVGTSLVQLPSDTGREEEERDGFKKCAGERNRKENEKIKNNIKNDIQLEMIVKIDILLECLVKN